MFYLGYMWLLSPDTIPGSRFELSERDLWQRKAQNIPPVTATIGFFLAGAAFVWPWMTRRKHLARVAWALALVTGGFGVLFGWVYLDVLTTMPCHEEADDCGPANAFRSACQVFYLLPIAAVLATGLWRRHHPVGQRLLAAGCAAIVAVITAYLAHWAASVWVPRSLTACDRTSARSPSRTISPRASRPPVSKTTTVDVRPCRRAT